MVFSYIPISCRQVQIKQLKEWKKNTVVHTKKKQKVWEFDFLFALKIIQQEAPRIATWHQRNIWQIFNSSLQIIFLYCQRCAKGNLGLKWFVYSQKQEDRILKLLYEQRGYKKWSEVAETMRTQYGILGRNGKQCRERYHNHLDQKISKAQWTSQEDQTLLRLHNQLGNRWALIARQITGRTDNCVKNRFYSRFRRSIKNVNELIKIFWKKKFKQLKPNFISKVIQMTQNYRKTQDQNRKALFEVCENLKCRLIGYSETTEIQLRQNQQSQENLFNLIKQINQFNRKNKRKGRKKKIQESDFEEQEEFANEERLKLVFDKRQSKDSIISPELKLEQNPELTIFQIKQQRIDENLCEIGKNPVMQKRADNESLIAREKQREADLQVGLEVIKLEMDGEQFCEKKKMETQEYISEKMQDGIDIYEFYNMQNISFSRQLYFY